MSAHRPNGVPRAAVERAVARCEIAEAAYARGVAAERERLLNTPELRHFTAGVMLEAQHQRERWGSEHEAGKAPPDWFWLLGYLAGKALAAHMAGNRDKALHHTISSAAALANWHASIAGQHTAMRPGIDPMARGLQEGLEAKADAPAR